MDNLYACVYKIQCKNDPSIIYIGSTKNFYSRVHNHCTNIRHGKKTKLYEQILNNGGIPNFTFEILKHYPNCDKIELRKHENDFINLLQPSLNSKLAYISEERRKELSNIRGKKFREKNKNYMHEYYKRRKNELLQ
tara:strand:+ start:3671 stop:4078 length:408 start_codon:yes stop_codon:yes gene_type:complete